MKTLVKMIVVVSALNAPAWIFVDPAVSDGANGNGSLHALPPGPESIWKLEDGLATSDGSLADHGCSVVVVVYDPHSPGVASGATMLLEDANAVNFALIPSAAKNPLRSARINGMSVIVLSTPTLTTSGAASAMRAGTAPNSSTAIASEPASKRTIMR